MTVCVQRGMWQGEVEGVDRSVLEEGKELVEVKARP